MKSYDISEIKRKFGHLLSYLNYICEINIASINYYIQHHPYFDFLENDRVDVFLSDNVSEICFKIFGAREKKTDTIIVDESFMYAGYSYISASISLDIPLRKLFLLFPLEKMLPLYPTYHEMSPFRIIERINEEIKDNSAFNILLNNSNYSLFQISKITGLDRRFLTSLKTDSSLEDKLTKNDVELLSTLLESDEVMFVHSKFSSFNLALWNDDYFIRIFKEKLSLIVGKTITTVNEKEMKENNASNYILIDYHDAYIYIEIKKCIKRYLIRNLI